ncbi:UDP-N-acetylmuramyl-tripeptide synthetase [bacterium]|nr:UDP-N-acetylmuramyl-tripeptide synthetase [bacterium]
MLSRIKKLVPKKAINAFHYTEALAASFAYRNPSKHMIVIGIVGSKGKTTLANLLWAALSGDGSKVGLIGTANIRIGKDEQLNPYHMTMPGRHRLQKTLDAMRRSGCQYAIMEVPSEGQAQWRHVGIHYDVLVFTNVTRELMASHDYSLDKLHDHNQRVFRQVAHQKPKLINGRVQPKILVANADAEHFPQYFAHLADIKRSYSIRTKSNYRATRLLVQNQKSSFVINKQAYTIPLPGAVNISNATGAIATALELGKSASNIQKGLRALGVIPGRMEPIKAGQKYTVLVDYAHEETGMEALMQTAAAMRTNATQRIITLLGAEGGGRDEQKRPIMGKIAMQGSDFVILSNVDPYRDDPDAIITDIAKGVEEAKGLRNHTYFAIPDRREGIRKALSLAKAGDIVLITGKGAEQSIIIDGKKSAWDDRAVVREELARLQKKPTTAKKR